MASVRFEAMELRVRVVSTIRERRKGLGGVLSLPEDGGMLFLYDAPQKYSMWMKGMRFPLDIIWLDAKKKVVYIVRDAQPESYPDSFTPRYPAQYVLEVNAGWTNRHHVEVGDIAEFSL